MMQLIDGIFSVDSDFHTGLDDRFIDWFESVGSLDWHEFYRMELSELNLAFWSSLGIDFGIPERIDDLTPDSLQDAIQRVKALKEGGKLPHERRLRKKASKEGIRWILLTRALRTQLICLVVHVEPMNQLMRKAEKGDEEAFLKLVQLDSSILGASFSRRILDRIELRQDVTFKKKLATLLIPEEVSWSFKGSRKEHRNILALFVLGWLGFEARPYSEWARFLDAHGYSNFAKEGNVARIANLYKVPKKHPKGRSNLNS